MPTRRFKQVDVFTARPYFGNPVAVVLDADGLTDEAMQRIARWTNLSETTFVLQPSRADADYRLRIFTPSSELPFAGHPTVGSAHAVLESGIVAAKAHLVQECGAGLLPLAIEGEGAARRIFVTAPAARITSLDAAHSAALTDALGAAPVDGAPPNIIALGPVWLVVHLADAASVSRLAPDMTRLAAFTRAVGVTGVTVFGRYANGEDAINVRSFAPAEGVTEDPVCGSGNAAVGCYVARQPALAALLPGYMASQGREIGRDGRVAVRIKAGRVEIGGQALTCIDGALLA